MINREENEKKKKRKENKTTTIIATLRQKLFFLWERGHPIFFLSTGQRGKREK